MSLSDYESTLKSYIHDDDKLVTYKWLSKELEIHVNVAKDILKQFYEKYQSRGDIVATYLLIGRLKDGSIRIEVVQESNLDAAKKKFVTIDCQHLYSLQKCLPDISLLALVGDGDLRYSAIKCDEKFLRDDDEIDALRYIGNVSKGMNKVEVTSKPVSSKVPDKSAPKQTSFFQNNKEKKADKEKEKPEVKKEVEESKPEAQTAAAAKKVSPPVKTSGGKSDKVSKKPLHSKQAGFSNLFGKVASKPMSTESKKASSNDEKEKKTTESVDNKIEVTKTKEEQKQVQEKENKKSHQDKDDKKQSSHDKSKSATKTDNKTNTKTKSKSSASDAKSKKRQRSQEKSNASKRKRIVVMDSSEDDSDNSDNEREEEPMEIEEEPPEPVKKRSPSPPAEKRENGKRMVRKLVDKTYLDEEGYLVTKRVHVYEAVEDDEKEAVQEPPPKAKPVDNKAKKQTTLMSFFKKS
ncbi:DNA polymerase delta subunit 3 [Copidosoma floridanum]|uniref:DNA polymerase delta subunit 3 n=1 Tax=Copidosoma floridanum TaxID=29053 RepID=UPI0006C956C8|nr:DNA polymerase delta subunit 3 [Copidosoma floridanum]